MSVPRIETPEEPQEPKRGSLKSQLLIGLAIMLVGAAMVGAEIGWIWYRVQMAADSITIHKRLLGSGFAFFFVGLLCMIGGSRAMSVLDKGNESLSQIKWYEWLILIGLGAAVVASYSGVEQYLETLGYVKPR